MRSGITVLTVSGTIRVCIASRNIGFLSKAFFPVKAFFGSFPYSANLDLRASLYTGLATVSILAISNFAPTGSSFVLYLYIEP